MISDTELVELAKETERLAEPLGQIYHFHPCGSGPRRPVHLLAAIALPASRSSAKSYFFYLEYEILDCDEVWQASGATSRLLAPGESGTLSLFQNLGIADGKYKLRGRLSSVDPDTQLPKKLDLQECDFEFV